MKLFNHTEITWIVCIVSLTSLQLNPALARQHHVKQLAAGIHRNVFRGVLGMEGVVGASVPIPRPREGRILPQERRALADYLLPINRINEAFSALEEK